MRGAIRLTEQDLEVRFSDVYDPILHERYRVGDVICQCSRCRAYLKAEHVRGSCPLCGLSPFTTAAVNPPAVINSSPSVVTVNTVRRIEPSYHHRKKQWLAFWCCVSTLCALLPLWLFDMDWLFADMTMETVGILVFLVAASSALVLYLWSKPRNYWENETLGPLLLGIPVLAPYGIAIAIWTALWLICIVFGIVTVVFIFCVLISIFD